MSLIEPPFGPLNGLHRYILNNALPITASPTPWIAYLFVPVAPLYLQAWLLMSPVKDPRTRYLRIMLCALGLTLIWSGYTSWRFTDIRANGFNCCFSVILLHVCVKYVEFALLEGPVFDPYMRRGRSRLVAAFDLCINSRLISMGSVGLDAIAGVPNQALPEDIQIERHLRHRGHLRKRRHSYTRPVVHPAQKRIAKRSSNGSMNNGVSTKTTMTSAAHQRPVGNSRPTTRMGSTCRHIQHAAAHYVFLDTLLGILGRAGPDSVNIPYGIPHAVEEFLARTGWVVLPGWLNLVVPRPIILFVTEASLPVAIWQGLSLGYHVFAAAAVGSGLWEVSSWDVDLFDAPWRADSMIDIWGKRWHQTFRHQFVILSVTACQLLGLPVTPFTLFPTSFVFSGLLHAVGGLSMDPVPSTWKLMAFFLLSGLGCALEVLFKRVTGRRVRGIFGRLWTWSYLFASGRFAVDAWLDAGIGGCTILPRNGPGDALAQWLMGWAFAPYRIRG